MDLHALAASASPVVVVNEEHIIDDDTFVPPIVDITQYRRDDVSGRAAFAPETCPFHGGTRRQPCSKFAVLPGDGRGPYLPTFGKVCTIMLKAALGPLLILGVIVGAIALLMRSMSGGIIPGLG